MNHDENTRVLLGFIHTLFCKKDHNTECNFYTEIELADCWDLPDVSCWITLTTLTMEAMDLNEEGLLKVLQKVHKVLGDLTRLNYKEQLLVKAIFLDADLSVLILSAHPLSASLVKPAASSYRSLLGIDEDLTY